MINSFLNKFAKIQFFRTALTPCPSTPALPPSTPELGVLRLRTSLRQIQRVGVEVEEGKIEITVGVNGCIYAADMFGILLCKIADNVQQLRNEGLGGD